MLFCFVGGGVTAAAYLETYIDQTKIIDNKYKEKIFFVFWFSLTIGRFAGCFVQQFLGDSGVIMSISLFSVGGFLSMILIFLFPYSTNALWIGVIFYGFFHGPTVGYCQDLNNRLTYLNENSMAIVMFGLVCGASFVPFFTALIKALMMLEFSANLYTDILMETTLGSIAASRNKSIKWLKL